jgi:hypothetical protein
MIVLTWRANGKPAAVFTSLDAMRAWLQRQGYGAGTFYLRHMNVPLDPH